MLTEKQIDQTMAELHDGIRSLDIWDALWLMGAQAKQAIDLAAENERLKAKLDALTAISEQDDRCYAQLKAKLDAVRELADPVNLWGKDLLHELAVIFKDGDET